MMKTIFIGIYMAAIKVANSQDPDARDIYEGYEYLSPDNSLSNEMTDYILRHQNLNYNQYPNLEPMLDYVRKIIKQNYHLPEQSDNAHPPVETALLNLEKLKRMTSGQVCEPGMVSSSTQCENGGNTNMNMSDNNFDSEIRMRTSDFAVEPVTRVPDLKSYLSTRSPDFNSESRNNATLLRRMNTSDRFLNRHLNRDLMRWKIHAFLEFLKHRRNHLFETSPPAVPVRNSIETKEKEIESLLDLVAKKVWSFKISCSQANPLEVKHAKGIIAGKIKHILQNVFSFDSSRESHAKITFPNNKPDAEMMRNVRPVFFDPEH